MACDRTLTTEIIVSSVLPQPAKGVVYRLPPLSYSEARKLISECPAPADLPASRGMLEVALEIVGEPETPGIEEGPLEALVR